MRSDAKDQINASNNNEFVLIFKLKFMNYILIEIVNQL